LLPVLVMDRSKSCAAIDVNDSMRDVNAVTTESAADPALPVPAKLVLLPSLDSPPPGLPPPLALLALLLALDKGGRFCPIFGGRGGVKEPAGEKEKESGGGRSWAHFPKAPHNGDKEEGQGGGRTLPPLPGFSCFCRALIICSRSYLRCHVRKGTTRGARGRRG
jgi:hypothetical protein